MVEEDVSGLDFRMKIELPHDCLEVLVRKVEGRGVGFQFWPEILIEVLVALGGLEEPLVVVFAALVDQVEEKEKEEDEEINESQLREQSH